MEELVFSSVDEVTGTSIVVTWSSEVLGEDCVTGATDGLATSPVETVSTDVTVSGGV